MEKKRVFLLVFIMIVIIVIASVIFFTLNGEKAKVDNQNIIRAAKCVANCPYEKTMVLNECSVACSEKYLQDISEGNINDEIKRKFGECFVLQEKEEEFDGCLNSFVNENKEIIDLTNEEVEVSYPTYKAEIVSANCSMEKTTVEIKIIQGENINKVGFSIKSDQEKGYPVIMRYDVPLINQSKIYEIIYSQENMEFSTKPNKISLGVWVGEKGYTKDEVSC